MERCTENREGTLDNAFNSLTLCQRSGCCPYMLSVVRIHLPDPCIPDGDDCGPMSCVDRMLPVEVRRRAGGK